MEGLYKNALKNYIPFLPCSNRMEADTLLANRISQKGQYSYIKPTNYEISKTRKTREKA